MVTVELICSRKILPRHGSIILLTAMFSWNKAVSDIMIVVGTRWQIRRRDVMFDGFSIGLAKGKLALIQVTLQYGLR